MATRTSIRYLTAALVAGLALSFAPTAPVLADEGPSVRAPRARTVVRTRVVERVRYVPPYYYADCDFGYGAPYYWAVRYQRYRHWYYR